MPAPCSRRRRRPGWPALRCNPRSRTRRFSLSTRGHRLLAFAMPSVESAGTALFLKRWLRRPLAMGAVMPSGRLLAEAMAKTAKAVLGGRPGQVVELGAGTGEVTKALLAAGIAPERLVLVERDPELAIFLRRHFPGPRIIEGDAARLPRLLADHGVASVAAVVSSLPLLTLPRGGALVQFTYGPTPPVPRALRERLQLDGVHGKRIWRNVPPAVVWTFTRPPAA